MTDLSKKTLMNIARADDPKPDSPAGERKPTPEHANYTHKTEIEPGLSPGEEMRIVELETGERQCIAVVINIETDDETEMMANAELFAAAPEVAAERDRLRASLELAQEFASDALAQIGYGELESARDSLRAVRLIDSIPARKDGER